MDQYDRLIEMSKNADRKSLEAVSSSLTGWEQDRAHTIALNRYLSNNDISTPDDMKQILPPGRVPLTNDITYKNQYIAGRSGGYIPATNSIVVDPGDKASLLHELSHNWDMSNNLEFYPKPIDRNKMSALKGLANAEATMSGHSQGRDIFEKQALFELLRSGHLRAPDEIPARNIYLSDSPDDRKPKHTFDPSIPRY
jgi:hypothetical protein